MSNCTIEEDKIIAEVNWLTLAEYYYKEINEREILLEKYISDKNSWKTLSPSLISDTKEGINNIKYKLKIVLWEKS